MKKCIVILLLSSYLFSTTQLCEFLKINRLVEHFIEHTNKDKNLTLLEFLCMHYVHSQVKDGDFEKDMKLPFKTLDTCHCAGLIFCTPIQQFDLTKQFVAKRYKTPMYRYHFSFSSSFHSAIWQPPKSC